MSQVDPWEKAAQCARAIERSTDPDETDFRQIHRLPIEDESRPAVKRAARFIQLLLLHAVLVHTGSVLSDFVIAPMRSSCGHRLDLLFQLLEPRPCRCRLPKSKLRSRSQAPSAGNRDFALDRPMFFLLGHGCYSLFDR